jgi:hypothetical protein
MCSWLTSRTKRLAIENQRNYTSASNGHLTGITARPVVVATSSGCVKGTIFAVLYRRLVPRLGHAQAIGAITHRLYRLIWKILHQGIRYAERGPAVSAAAKRVRARAR